MPYSRNMVDATAFFISSAVTFGTAGAHYLTGLLRMIRESREQRLGKVTETRESTDYAKEQEPSVMTRRPGSLLAVTALVAGALIALPASLDHVAFKWLAIVAAVAYIATFVVQESDRSLKRAEIKWAKRYGCVVVTLLGLASLVFLVLAGLSILPA